MVDPNVNILAGGPEPAPAPAPAPQPAPAPPAEPADFIHQLTAILTEFNRHFGNRTNLELMIEDLAASWKG